MRRTVVLDVVGLTPSLLDPSTPRLLSFGRERARIRPITPAVTCSAQATYLTPELSPRDMGIGIVANGWYFRDLNGVWLWRQSNRLVQGDKIRSGDPPPRRRGTDPDPDTPGRKALGFRYTMEVTPVDAALVKGSHGLVGSEPGTDPILMSSEPGLLPGDSIEATRIRDCILEHVFRE